MGAVTISDVARESGLSVGTVSRVIRGLSNVRPAKVVVVKAAIARLGYQPLPDGKRPGPRGPHKTKEKAGRVDVFFTKHSLKWIMNCAPVYATVLHGIETALARHGFTLSLQQVPDWSTAPAGVNNQKVKGIIFFGQAPDGQPSATYSRIPAVYAMGSPRRIRLDHIGVDHHAIGELAAEYALAKGHRNCAYLGTGIDHVDNTVKARGYTFKGLIEEAGGTVQLLTDPAIESANDETQWINEDILAQQLDRLAAASPRPTVLMLQADMYAPSVYRQLLERGLRPQHDLVIITCNNERSFLNALRPAPVVIDLRSETIGHRAVEQLLWRIQHPNEPPMRTLIEPLLLDSADLVTRGIAAD